MAEIKTHYNINNLDARDINFVLNQIANRLDALEGLRGTPRFYADINAGANKITNATEGDASGEVLTYPVIISDFTSAQHDHENATGGGTLDHGTAMTAASLLDNDHPQYFQTFVNMIMLTDDNVNPSTYRDGETWVASEVV
jgi:hypothetical protein